MKGIIFTAFLDMSEELYGYRLVDELIEESNLPSKGVYTAIGTYPHSEMETLLVNLSRKVNAPPCSLLETFGKHLFGVLSKTYPYFFARTTTSFELLMSVDSHIHVEVRKLYPDAELPHFEVTRVAENILWMDYYSDRNMNALAYGLIQQCIRHYGEKATISQQVLEEKRNATRFEIVIEP